jgi:hypothetical protein
MLKFAWVSGDFWRTLRLRTISSQSFHWRNYFATIILIGKVHPKRDSVTACRVQVKSRSTAQHVHVNLARAGTRFPDP